MTHLPTLTSVFRRLHPKNKVYYTDGANRAAFRQNGLYVWYSFDLRMRSWKKVGSTRTLRSDSGCVSKHPCRFV